jgi:citrate synthase
MQPSIQLPITFLGELSEKQVILLNALMKAHQSAARDNANASSGVAQIAWGGSGNFLTAVIGAVSTLGDLHGPFDQARKLFSLATEADVKSAIERRQLVPGFGCSFHRGDIDPAFNQVRDLLSADWPDVQARMQALTQWVNSARRIYAGDAGAQKSTIYPNAALFTAAVATVVGVPAGLEPVLFILPRIIVWAELCNNLERGDLWDGAH